jgi:hypothetical protein
MVKNKTILITREPDYTVFDVEFIQVHANIIEDNRSMVKESDNTVYKL